MKKLIILSIVILMSSFLMTLSAQTVQTAPNQKVDTTKNCKPSKSGKHCSKPSKG